MKKLALLATALAMVSGSALAADLKVKAVKAPPPPAFEPWDIAFGSAIMNDYIFRGVTQSNHKPSVTAYFEPRYNVTKDVQLYVGTSFESISFPNRAAAEVDVYGGARVTLGAFAFDVGAWGYLYPGGTCFNGAAATPAGVPLSLECQLNTLVNGNVIKKDLTFWEVYAKGTYAVNDQVSIGGTAFYSPSVLNSGANGTYVTGGAKLTAPSAAMPEGWGLYLSGDAGKWFLGTSDAFYCTQVGVPGCTAPFPNGIPYKSYTTWNVGIAITKSVFTLDFRYYDTDMNQGDCNAFTSDQNARFTNSVTSINPGGFGSSWCGSSFVVAGKFDLTAMANLK